MCKLVVEASAEESTSWGDLYKLLPQLRHALACTVCGSIIQDPIGTSDQMCQHHVCAGCKGGKKRLKPSCGYCRDYQMYVPNKQLALIVKAFRKTCQYLQHTDIYEKLNSFSLNGSRSSLVELIQEGSGLELPRNWNSDNSDECFVTSHVKSEEVDSEHSSNESVTYHGNIHIASSMNTPPNTSHVQGMVRPVTESHPLLPHPDPAVCFTQALTSQTSSSPSPPPILSLPVGHPFYPRFSKDVGMISKLKHVPAEAASFNASSFMTSHSQKGEANNGRLVHPMNGLKVSKKKVHRGCRCGNATPTPGKLTCCGQRCPCYVESRACVNCKCRGCRNSHRPGGRKVHQHAASQESVKTQDLHPSLSPSSLSQSPVLHQPPVQVPHLPQTPVVHTSSGPATVHRFHPQHQPQMYQPMQAESPLLPTNHPHLGSSHQGSVNVQENSPHSHADLADIHSSHHHKGGMHVEAPSHQSSQMRIESSHASSAPLHIDSCHYSSGSLQIDSHHHQTRHLPPVHQVIHMPHQVFQAPVFINTVPVAAISGRVFMTDSSQSSDSIEV